LLETKPFQGIAIEENRKDPEISETEEKISDLTNFGLTPLQAKVYVRLLMLGPSPARRLSSIVGINRVDTYRILRGLRKRGLLDVLISEPSKYIAVEPSRAVEMLISEKEKQISELRVRSSRIIKWLDAISNTELESFGLQSNESFSVTHFRLKYGIRMIESLRKLVRESEVEICKIWSAPGLVFHAEQGLLEEFEKAAGRGVKIKGLVEITDQNIENVQYLSRFANLRSARNLSTTLRYTISDSKEVLVNATQAPLEQAGVMAFWTDNEAIVHGFNEDFWRKWNASGAIALLH
jgi:sugar-specific transcriptional regulator TrmB